MSARRVTLGSLVVSGYLWTVAFGFAFLGLPLILASLFVCPRPVTYRLFLGLIRFGMRLSGISVTVEGAEHLDPSKPAIVVCNHVNILDPFLLATVLPKSLIVLEKPDNFRYPLYGEVMRRWGNIPLTRGNLDQTRRDLVRASEVLHAGERWILVFPEGTRTRTGYFSPFKKGAFHLAAASGVPIVALTQNGAMDVWTKGQYLLCPGTVEVTVHPPIDPRPFGEDRVAELAEHVRRTILSAYRGPKALEDVPLPIEV